MLQPNLLFFLISPIFFWTSWVYTTFDESFNRTKRYFQSSKTSHSI